MTNASVAASPAPIVPTPWLFGAKTDLVWGYGLAYIVSVPLLVLFSVRGGESAVWLPFLLSLLISTPHYGATLLRVYEQRADRRKYAIFSVWITLVLLFFFAVSLYVGLLGSLLLTLYVTWSPWHFSGQNYGISLMFMRRSGFNPGPEIRRPLYAFFVASASMAIAAMHMAAQSWNFTARNFDESGVFHIISLKISYELAAVFGTIVGIVWLSSIGIVVFRLLRRGQARVLAPLGVLFGMQALWYLPSLSALVGWVDFGAAGLAFTAIWIATAHAIQYLWITYYYARHEGRTGGVTVFFGKTWLAGGLFMVPVLLLAPGLFADVAPNAAGVAALAIAVLNIHHFFLDGAIWKLRDGRIARILLRDESASDDPGAAAGSRFGPLAVAVWTIAIVSLGAQIYTMSLFYSVSRENVALQRLEGLAGQLAWLGQDTPGLWARLGMEFEKTGRPIDAEVAYRRSLERTGVPPPPWAINRFAWLLLGRADSNPEVLDEAATLAKNLVRSLGPRRPEGYQTLAEVHMRAGRPEQAVGAANRALKIARASGDQQRVALLERQIARYGGQVGSSDLPDGGAMIDPPRGRAPGPGSPY